MDNVVLWEVCILNSRCLDNVVLWEVCNLKRAIMGHPHDASTHTMPAMLATSGYLCPALITAARPRVREQRLPVRRIPFETAAQLHKHTHTHTKASQPCCALTEQAERPPNTSAIPFHTQAAAAPCPDAPWPSGVPRPQGAAACSSGAAAVAAGCLGLGQLHSM